MPAFTPGTLIYRHVEKLRKYPNVERVDQVLAQAGLTIVGDQAVRNGRVAVASDCEIYKRAVRAVYGEAVYSFARVNFVLGGCQCAECAAEPDRTGDARVSS